jgi:hypothetical protein
MKKLITLALMAMMSVMANAGSIVFGELGLENGVQYADPFDGGDFTVTFGGGGNNGKYYTTGTGIRVYGGGTMTIAAKSGKLTKIAITYDGTNKPTTADVVSVGTYDADNGIWTGDAESVVFTRPSGSGHWRVKSIATGSDAQEPEKPTEGQTPETAITVTRALELINALEDGKSTDFTYYVKGYATSIDKIITSGASFYMGDAADATNTVKIYNLKGFGNKDITNTEFVAKGDAVVVYGTLQKYKNNSTGDITPEVSSGYVYSVNGKTEDDTPNPEDAIKKGATAEDAMTAEEALTYIDTFSDGFTTSKQYYVKGTVSEVTEISTEKGNATFTMGRLTVYRMKGLENKSITTADYVKANDEVIVLAKLQRYKKDDTVTPELSSGYIYSLNGKTQEEVAPVTFEGDGSEANPYTVTDVRKMVEESYPTETVWVKGVIVGSAKSATELNTEDKASNIAIAKDEDSSSEFIPVELKSESDARTQLNVVDNPNNFGKTVWLYGKIQKYFGVAGVKNLEAFKLEGQEQFVKGDANGDGNVDVADVVAIVNYILNKPGENFNEKAADANNDGNIDVADVVAVVNIILTSGSEQ